MYSWQTSLATQSVLNDQGRQCTLVAFAAIMKKGDTLDAQSCISPNYFICRLRNVEEHLARQRFRVERSQEMRIC